MTTTPPAPAPPDAPRRAVTARRRWPKVVLIVAIALVLIVGGLAVYAYTLSNRVTQNITRGVDLPGDPSETPRPVNETGTLNYVLLGSDSRDPDNEANGRSDSIMVVHLNTKRTKAYIISFPRDMYVDHSRARPEQDQRRVRPRRCAAHRTHAGEPAGRTDGPRDADRLRGLHPAHR